MNIILDILAAVIFIFTVINGYRKGFLRTVLNLCGGIICLAVAMTLSPTVGNYINESYMAPTFEKAVTDRLTELAPAQEQATPDIDLLIREEPNEFVKILESFNINLEAFKQQFELLKKESAENTTQAAVEYVAKPISQTLSYILAFILLLIASTLVLSILKFLLDKVVKLPFLRTANRFLGIIAGILFAFLWIYVLSMIVEIALPYLKNASTPLLSQTDPSATLLFKYFYGRNPIYELVKVLL